MRKILIISFSNIRSDPRVMRQIMLLQYEYAVTVAGFGSKPDANISFIDISHAPPKFLTKVGWGLKLLLGMSENYYWNHHRIKSALKKLADLHSFDMVIANDLASLPLALRLADKAPVLFDAHEYSPRELDNSLFWKLLFGRLNHYLCKQYLHQVGGITTVCQGIADEYAKNYGVVPKVVYNAPEYKHLEPSPVQSDRIRMIHHGLTIRARHLETMIEMMSYLDQRFTLDFMLVENDPGYMRFLREKAAGDSRIRFIPPVPMHDICSQLNQYDLGVYLLPPVNFNHEHALPNKFFEFIQARLAVAIGPSPEMARLVKQYSFGVVAPTFNPSDLAATISSITSEDLQRYKMAASDAAQACSYEASGNITKAEVVRLLNS